MPNSSGGILLDLRRRALGELLRGRTGRRAAQSRPVATRPNSKNPHNLIRSRCYPCQTCLPQAQCTVSLGSCFVNCRLQIGQGLVITYVIFLPLTKAKSPVRYGARRLPENLTVCRPAAQWQHTLRKTTSRVRLCQAQQHYSFIDLPGEDLGRLSRSALDRLLEGCIGSCRSL